MPKISSLTTYAAGRLVMGATEGFLKFIKGTKLPGMPKIDDFGQFKKEIEVAHEKAPLSVREIIRAENDFIKIKKDVNKMNDDSSQRIKSTIDNINETVKKPFQAPVENAPEILNLLDRLEKQLEPMEKELELGQKRVVRVQDAQYEIDKTIKDLQKGLQNTTDRKGIDATKAEQFKEKYKAINSETRDAIAKLEMAAPVKEVKKEELNVPEPQQMQAPKATISD